MMDELMKMMAKKKSKGGEMSEDAVKAKMDVIAELLEMAQSAMGSKVKGGLDEMKKVSVMAPDEESLAEGLEVAQELTSSDEEASEEPSEETEVAEEKAPESESSDEDSSIFGKRKPKDAPKKKLFSMLD